MSTSANIKNTKENLEKFSALLIPVAIAVVTFIAQPSDSARENFIAATVNFLATMSIAIWLARRFKHGKEYSEEDDEVKKYDIKRFQEFFIAYWITPLRSLIPASLKPYSLKLKYRSDLVIYGTSSKRHDPKNLEEAFFECANRLLLLGHAGSGKTFTMFQMAEDIINRNTEPDKSTTYLVPLYLSLSTWDGTAESFESWIYEETSRFHGYPEDTTAYWLENPKGKHLTLLMLDDLNNVIKDKQQSCVDAINEFLARNKRAYVLVACRSENYEAMDTQLALAEAVEISIMDEAKVKDYLLNSDLDSDLAPDVKDVIIENYNSWGEKSRSLRMLNIMIQVASNNDSSNELISGRDIDTLLSNYTDQQLKDLEDMVKKERWVDVKWTMPQIKHYLGQLANYIQKNEKTEFWIERIQPSWLPNYKIWYEIMVYLICFLAIFIPGYFAAGLAFNDGRPEVWYLGAPSLSAALAGIVLLSREAHIRPIIRTLLIVFLMELAILPMASIFAGLDLSLSVGVLFALPILFIVFISLRRDIGGSIGQYKNNPWSIYPVERLGVSYTLGLFGLIFTAIIVLFTGFVVAHIDIDIPDVHIFLIPTLLPMGLASVLHGDHIEETELRVRVNFGIKRSTFNATLVFIVFGLIAGLLGCVWMTLVTDLGRGIIFGVFQGIFVGMTQAILWGGFAVVQHFVLRIFLRLTNTFPFYIEHFLNVTSRCTLMMPSGGYYTFYPPEIKDYFIKND